MKNNNLIEYLKATDIDDFLNCDVSACYVDYMEWAEMNNFKLAGRTTFKWEVCAKYNLDVVRKNKQSFFIEL